MPREEGLLLLMGEGQDEGHPRVAQPGAEELDRGELPRQDDLRRAPVDLGALPRREGERHEDLALPVLQPPHRHPDRRLAPGEAVLLPQLHPHLASAAALLRRLLLVVDEPLLQERQHRPHHRLRARRGQPIARRVAPLPQILVDRLPRATQLRRDLPLAPPLPVIQSSDKLLVGHVEHAHPPRYACRFCTGSVPKGA